MMRLHTNCWSCGGDDNDNDDGDDGDDDDDDDDENCWSCVCDESTSVLIRPGVREAATPLTNAMQ